MSARHFASSQPEESATTTEPTDVEATGNLTADETPVESVEVESPNAYMPVEKVTHHHHRHHRHHSSSSSSDGKEDDKSTAYMPVEKYTHHHHRSGHRSKGGRSSTTALKGVKRVLIALAVILVLVVGAALAYAMHLNSEMAVDAEEREGLTAALASQDNQSKGFYVLLVGSDRREHWSYGRGDVLMLARVDPTTSLVTLVSIPRDTMVRLEGYEGHYKINESYARGGSGFAVSTISEFAGVPISHYAEVEFSGIERIIDTLGGVTVNIPQAIELEGQMFAPGPTHLNGAQALALARRRKGVSGADFARSQMQRLIVTDIINQLRKVNPTQLPGLMGELMSNVQTDYSVTDLVQLVMQFQGQETKVYQAECPSYGYPQADLYYVGTKYAEWADMMKRVDAGLDPNDTGTEIPEPQFSSTTLGAATNAMSPKDYSGLKDTDLQEDDVIMVDQTTVME